MSIEITDLPGQDFCTGCLTYTEVYMVASTSVWNRLLLCRNCLKELREDLNPLRILVTTGKDTK